MQEWLSENWLWLVIVVYLVSMMLYCHYIGFMRTALSFLTAVVAIVITRLILPTVSGWATKVFHLEDIPIFKLNILLFLAVFIILLILLKLLIHATDLVSNIPVIHGLNQIAGAVLGVCLGIIFIWLVFLIVSAFNETGWATEIIIKVNESKFVSFIWNHNLISTLLKNAIASVI